MAEGKELIDLNKLTERELLILLNSKVERMEDTVNALEKGQIDIALKVNTIETKSKVWGGVVGFITAVGSIFLDRVINK